MKIDKNARIYMRDDFYRFVEESRAPVVLHPTWPRGGLRALGG